MADYARSTSFKKEVEERNMKTQDLMKAQVRMTFAARARAVLSSILPIPKNQKPKKGKGKAKAKIYPLSSSSTSPSSATSPKSAMSPGQTTKGTKEESLFSPPPTSPSSATSPNPATSPVQTAAQASNTPQILVDDDERDSEKDRHFIMRCHMRSYLYPVGTPMYWFRSLLELICVLRDILESECSQLP
jgi:hypothetical protein